LKLKECRDEHSKQMAESNARISLLESEKNAKAKEAEEWEEIATDAKRDKELVVRRSIMEKQDLQANLETLEATKQALQREAEMRAAKTANARAEFDRATKEMQAEKEALQMKIAKSMGEVDKEKLDMGVRITALELERGAKERESAEWQQEAMDAKKSAEETRRVSTQIVRDLEAEVLSLKATKAAMMKESKVRMQVLASDSSENP